MAGIWLLELAWTTQLSLCAVSCFLLRCSVYLLSGLLRCHSSAVMDAPDYSSPVRTYVHNYYSMRKSHDADSSEPQSLSSLCVVNLDLSIMPDVFGLYHFDGAKPLTRMLT